MPAIAERLSALGFEAAPARSEAAAELRRKEHRKGLARLGIAALVTMQIMMLSLADYLDLLSDLTPAYRQLLLWAQAVLATVLVERKSQKGILIGKGGAMLKTIGQGARLQMQTLIDGPVYLELFVKVVPNWRTSAAKLNELGYSEERM